MSVAEVLVEKSTPSVAPPRNLIPVPFHRSTCANAFGVPRYAGVQDEARGYPVFSTTEVVTAYEHLFNEPWENLSRDDQTWLTGFFRDLHDARCEVEALERDHRWLAKEELERLRWPENVEDWPHFVRDTIERTRP